MNEVYVGVDCGEAHHSFVLLDTLGEMKRSWRVRNRETDLRKELAFLGSESEGRVNLVVESLYSFSTLLVGIARDLGFNLWQVNPKAVKSYRDLEGEQSKTDAIDAYLAARMAFLKMKGCRLAIQPTEDEQKFRHLSRARKRLVNQRTPVELRLRSLLMEKAPEIFQKSWPGPIYTRKSFMLVLERWPGFEGLERVRLSTIAEILKKCGTGEEARHKQAEALKTLAKSLPKKRDTWTMELSFLICQIQLLGRQIDEVERRILDGIQSHPIGKKLLKQPGLGPVTAATLVGEALALARNAKESKVATYAGLTPVARRSGQSGRDVMWRGTNKYLLDACYMSAVASLQRSAMDRAYYDKQRRLHKGHPKEHVVATIALARQRFKVMYKLMTTDAEYDAEILISSHFKRIEACVA